MLKRLRGEIANTTTNANCLAQWFPRANYSTRAVRLACAKFAKKDRGEERKWKEENTLTSRESIFGSTRLVMSLLRYSDSISGIYAAISKSLSSSTRLRWTNQFAGECLVARPLSRHLTSSAAIERDEMRNERRFRKLGKIILRRRRTVSRFLSLFLSFSVARCALRSGNAAQCNLIRANAKIARRSLFASLSLVILFRWLTVKSQNFPCMRKCCPLYAPRECGIYKFQIFYARALSPPLNLNVAMT